MERYIKKKRHAYRYGHVSEYMAMVLLTFKGYRLLARRHKTPFGEIDLIAKKRQKIIFIEVKARKNKAYLIDALDNRQCRRIENAAQWYIERHSHYHSYHLRFDMMLVHGYRVPRHIIHAW